jgi:hypothetical protein
MILRTILPALLALLALTLSSFVLSVSGCGGANKEGGKDRAQQRPNSIAGDKKHPEKDGSGEKEKTPKADFSLTSDEFAAEVKRDKNAAKAKYKDKQIQLKGEITRIERSNENYDYLWLATGKDDPSLGCVTKEKEPWKIVFPGQTVNLVGKLVDDTLSVEVMFLKDCVIVGQSGPVPPTLAANELAKEYAVDGPATTKKYDQLRAIILKGEIEKIESEKSGATVIIFRTEDKGHVVSSSFSQFYKSHIAGLKAGQKIAVVGRYANYSRNGEKTIGNTAGGILEIGP